MGHTVQPTPFYQNYLPTWTGFSVIPSGGANQSRFAYSGKMVTYDVYYPTNGTNNSSTVMTVTLPAVAKKIQTFNIRITSAGAVDYGLLVTQAGSNIAIIFVKMGNAFPADVLGKNAYFSITFEAQ